MPSAAEACVASSCQAQSMYLRPQQGLWLGEGYVTATGIGVRRGLGFASCALAELPALRASGAWLDEHTWSAGAACFVWCSADGLPWG